MSDAIAFAFTWTISTLALFAPTIRRAPGRHSGAHLAADRASRPAIPPMPEKAPEILPPHVQERYRTLRGEDIPLVRPYVLARPRKHGNGLKDRVQAERRWALDMALRGYDVGPTKIHGVHVAPGIRTIHLNTRKPPTSLRPCMVAV
ncbi:hypothetical protein ACIQNI_08690 [Streptomyces sp. NPDC091266]|uniref:hypothetical protein n=1 Tax=Streptomyces sp. NPDC091266 TaxID=3365978 RepID=UPI00382D7338